MFIRLFIPAIGVLFGIIIFAQSQSFASEQASTFPTRAESLPSVAALAGSVVHDASELIVERRQNGPDGQFWNFPSYLGTHFISQYFLISRWLGHPSPGLDPGVLSSRLLNTQLADGSWYAVPDTNLDSGDLNATILDYWALKAMGQDMASPPLSRARDFIVTHGGIEHSSHFTKILLALFRNYSWSDLPSIPYLLFTDLSPVNTKSFAQWIGPHLTPMAYFKKMRLSKDLGADFDLGELWADPAALGAFREHARSETRDFPHALSTDRLLIDKIIAGQQPAGSFGGYTVATLFSLMAINDFSQQVDAYQGKAAQAAERGLSFVEQMYFGSGESNYLGVTDDGRYWDTALLGIALKEAGTRAKDLRAVAQYLVSIQSANGGFPFGIDFGYAPDTDDTAEIILFLSKLNSPQYASAISRGLQWISSMQNSDGGWGAFSHNNTGNAILRAAAKDFEDSADLFDPSSPDVTGHLLEALASQGLTSDNSQEVRNAVRYLKASQLEMGGWTGRWGINTLYGTGAAVVGLLKAGEKADAPYLQKALIWLLSKQNADGGFGESSRSYVDTAYAGVGRSTPSQTAWVLLALIESDLAKTAAAQNAAQYLVDDFIKHGRWIDSSTVGTGHPGVVYMNYPSYPYAFPLVALTRYLRRVANTP